MLAECVTATGVGDVGKAAEGTARRFRWITRYKVFLWGQLIVIPGKSGVPE